MARKTINMIEGTLWDKILMFALPLAITGIFQQLFNAVDVAVIGRFVGKEAMAAVGCNTPVLALMVNLFLGLSLGINVVIARYTGMRNPENIHKTIHTAIITAIVAGLCIAIPSFIFAPQIMTLLSVPPDVLEMAELYFKILAIGLPSVVLYNFEAAMFTSQGDTRTPLVCLTICGVINAVLNLLFVCVFHMNVDGVAYATVIANTLSSVILFVILLRSKTDLRVRWNEFHVDKKILKSITKIGLPAGIQGMVFSFSNIIIQSAINSLGADVMAASAAAFNIEILVYFILNSFGQAATTFVGQNYGAGNFERCMQVMRTCIWQNLAFTIVISGVLLLVAQKLLTLFNSDPVVTEYGMIRLYFILLPEAINVILEVFSGVLRGFGHSLAPAIAAFVGICGVRIIWVYTVFQEHHTFEVLMTCYGISWLVATIGIGGCFIQILPKIKQNMPKPIHRSVHASTL